MSKDTELVEIRAISKYIKISPQKARLVVDLIRKKSARKALEILSFTPKKAAGLVKKTLESAISNAENTLGADLDDLYVSSVYVDEAPTLKRISPRAKGRADRIFKRSSHITVKVAEI